MAAENHNAPTVKPNKGVRFYNPGDRFSEPLNYSIDGIGDIHAIARWMIDADEKSFFQVPTELRLAVDGTRISVDFPTTVLQKFKDRGVIMIDEEYEEPKDDDERSEREPFAATDAEAVVKGNKAWRRYLERIVKNHIEQCQRAATIGGIPMEASGFTRRAFKLLNITDPATKQMELLSADAAAKTAASKPSDDPRIAALEAQVAASNQTMERILALLNARNAEGENDAIESRTAKATEKTNKQKANRT